MYVHIYAFTSVYIYIYMLYVYVYIYTHEQGIVSSNPFQRALNFAQVDQNVQDPRPDRAASRSRLISKDWLMRKS